jgi:hypothetical protein
MDATTNFIDHRHYFCAGRSKNIIKDFPLSNQSPDHTLEAVDKQQWLTTAGVWTETDVQGVSKTNVPVRLLVTRFTNAISCFEPGSQEPYKQSMVYEMFYACVCK